MPADAERQLFFVLIADRIGHVDRPAAQRIAHPEGEAERILAQCFRRFVQAERDRIGRLFFDGENGILCEAVNVHRIAFAVER